MKESKAYIILTAIFKREEDVWTAECKELGTATFGESLDEAREALMEAIELHVNTLEDVGETKRFFVEHGIQIHYDERPDLMHIPELPFDPNILISQNVQPLPFALAWPWAKICPQSPAQNWSNFSKPMDGKREEEPPTVLL